MICCSAYCIPSEISVLKCMFHLTTELVLLLSCFGPFKELESLKIDKLELIDALEGESWLKERENLLSALEEEKDKTSTWQEEKDTLTDDLKEAHSTIKQLQDDKECFNFMPGVEEVVNQHAVRIEKEGKVSCCISL